jgi:N-methylhydantoinase A/oxoprolinase/acetone carboxylase beta subunit
LALSCLAAQLGLDTERFCEGVVEAVSTRVAMELVTKVLGDEVAVANWQAEPVAAGLLARALNVVQETDLACRLTLRQPVVAVGAPVSAYMPQTAARLHTDLVLPPHADVANAVGAVVGSVVQRAEVLIRPIDFGARYRVHLPGNLGVSEGVRASDGVHDCATLEEGVAYAEEVVPGRLRALAQKAGARQVEIQLTRTDHMGSVHEKIDEAIFLESVLTFTAVGRPAAGA